jgi:hypothetical protein
MLDFIRKQVGKLLWWLIRSFLIAYGATWIIATIIEVAKTGNLISPVWPLEMI